MDPERENQRQTGHVRARDRATGCDEVVDNSDGGDDHYSPPGRTLRDSVRVDATPRGEQAGVTQLVECQLPKLTRAGVSVSRQWPLRITNFQGGFRW